MPFGNSSAVFGWSERIVDETRRPSANASADARGGLLTVQRLWPQLVRANRSARFAREGDAVIRRQPMPMVQRPRVDGDFPSGSQITRSASAPTSTTPLLASPRCAGPAHPLRHVIQEYPRADAPVRSPPA